MNGPSSSWYKHVIKNEYVYSLTAQEYCTGAHNALHVVNY